MLSACLSIPLLCCLLVLLFTCSVVCMSLYSLVLLSACLIVCLFVHIVVFLFILYSHVKNKDIFSHKSYYRSIWEELKCFKFLICNLTKLASLLILSVKSNYRSYEVTSRNSNFLLLLLSSSVENMRYLIFLCLSVCLFGDIINSVVLDKKFTYLLAKQAKEQRQIFLMPGYRYNVETSSIL